MAEDDISIRVATDIDTALGRIYPRLTSTTSRVAQALDDFMNGRRVQDVTSEPSEPHQDAPAVP